MPRYAYGAWPSTLHPAGELLQQGLAVPPAPDGCTYQLREPHWLWLYDERKAAPVQKTLVTRLRAFFERQHRCCVCGCEATGNGGPAFVRGMCPTCRFQAIWSQQVQSIRTRAQDLLHDPQAMLLDTETTGLGEQDVVIELALLSVAEGKSLLNTCIRPDRPIGLDAIRRHGLTNAALRDAPTFREVWRELLPLLERYPTVFSYDAAFHRRHLAWTAQVSGYHLPSLAWHCLMTWYAAFYGKVRDASNTTDPFQWQSLCDACKQQHTDAGRSPRALSQVKRARRLLEALAKPEGNHYDGGV